MKKEIADQWVKALRSGEYAQCRGQLHSLNDDGKDSFCCLGVLCDLHRQSTGFGEWGDLDGEVYSGGGETTDQFPTSNVVSWAGLRHMDPKVDNPGLPREGVDGAMTIAELNDILRWTFNELANLIEQQWEGM